MRPLARVSLGLCAIVVSSSIAALPTTSASATVSPAVVMTTVTSGVPAPAKPRKIVSGWMPYWSNSAALASVLANASLFADVSPFWYHASGSAPNVSVVSQTTGINVPSVVAQLHARGISILPTITDGSGYRQMSAQLDTAAHRAAMVARIVAVVSANGYDGVDLDWEAFAFNDGSSSWTTTRARWIPFVAALGAALHAKKKLLSVTAPGGLSTSSDSTGYWVYAWGAIGPYIDRLRIMAYDYSVSHAGPIAPIGWVDRVAAYAITQVSPSKISIGVAGYGRDWKTAATGTCPNLPLASLTPAQATTFADKLSWVAVRHSFDARWAANYVDNLFVSAAATIPGITLVTKPVSTWDATAKERTFSYQVNFAGRFQRAKVTATAVAGVAGSSTITVSSTVGIAVGTVVAGTGVASGAKVTGISGKVLTVSAANTAAVTGVIVATTHVSTTATGDIATPLIAVAKSAGIPVGAAVSGTGIASGATVLSIAVNSLTLSVPNTAAVSGAVTFSKVVKPVAIGGVVGAKVIQVGVATGINVGAGVTGKNVAPGAKVTAISGHALTLSIANLGSVTGSLVFTPAPTSVNCTVSRTGWYGEAGSANARATLVNKYHLGGIAQWTLGGEDTTQWAGLTSYATNIAPVSSLITASAPQVVDVGASTSVTGTVKVKGALVPQASVALSVRPVGSTTWPAPTTVVTNAAGQFTLPMQGQSADFEWRVTAPTDGWTRATTAVVGQTTAGNVPSVITAVGPAGLLPGKPGTVRASVSFKNALLANAPTTLAVQAAGATTWTTVASGSTDSTGAVALTLPAQKKDFTWRITVPAGGLRRETSVSRSAVIAVAAVAKATASAIVTYGAPNPVKGTVTLKGAPVSAQLSMQVLVSGTTSWVTVASPTSTGSGAFAAVIPKQAHNYRWRVVVPTNGTTRLAATASGSVQVRLRVVAHAKTAAIKALGRPVFIGTVGPARAGYRVSLRTWSGTVWVVQSTVLSKADGTYTLTAKAQARGSATYDVVSSVVAGQANVNGMSARLIVTAS